MEVDGKCDRPDYEDESIDISVDQESLGNDSDALPQDDAAGFTGGPVKKRSHDQVDKVGSLIHDHQNRGLREGSSEAMPPPKTKPVHRQGVRNAVEQPLPTSSSQTLPWSSEHQSNAQDQRDVNSPEIDAQSREQYPKDNATSPDSATSDAAIDGINDVDDHGADDDDDDLPEQPLQSFDWDDLEHRYQEMIVTKDQELEKAYQEFYAVCDVFQAWGDMSNMHETALGSKRQKTQKLFVRQKEQEAEKLRDKYEKVVNAFKSAMEMLS